MPCRRARTARARRCASERSRTATTIHPTAARSISRMTVRAAGSADTIAWLTIVSAEVREDGLCERADHSLDDQRPWLDRGRCDERLLGRKWRREEMLR